MKNGIQFGAGFVIGMLLIYMVLGLVFWLFWGRTLAKTTAEE
jgi:hypothetical protein